MSQARSTTNHDEIRRWIESRKGHPSFVKSTRRGDSGLLRVDFGKPEEGFEEISWDQFFDTFDKSNLAFLYQDTTASGRKSRFNKFVERDASADRSADEEEDDDLEDEDELDEAEEADEDDADEDWDDDDEDEDEDEDEDDLDDDDDDDDDFDEDDEDDDEEDDR